MVMSNNICIFLSSAAKESRVLFHVSMSKYHYNIWGCSVVNTDYIITIIMAIY